MSHLPLSQLFSDSREDNVPVCVHQGRIVFFKEFRADVAAVASCYKNFSRVAVITADSYWFTVGIFATLVNGGIVVLPPNALPETLEILRGEIDIILDDSAMKNAGEIAGYAFLPLDVTREAFHFYTSGSTGAPKKVSKTLEMLQAEIALFEATWGVGLGRGTVFATVPHVHLYALTFKILWSLATARPFHSQMHDYWEALLLELSEDAIIISSPAHLSRLGGLPLQPQEKQPNRVFSAGAPLSFKATQEAAQILGVVPTEIFGSTETGAIATRQQHETGVAWAPLAGITVTVDAESKMIVQSPLIGAEALVTDDLITLAAEGFHSHGRADRTIKIEGKRISLIGLEKSLVRSPYIQEAIVAIVDMEPSRLGAVVVLNETGHAALNEMGLFSFKKHLREELQNILEPAAIPRLWRFVEMLPVNALGKQLASEIKALFSEAA